MSQGSYNYQCPVILGSGFTKSSSPPPTSQPQPQTQEAKISCFRYEINIEGNSTKFYTLLTPTYIGYPCQFSIKFPTKLKDKNQMVIIGRRKVRVSDGERHEITEQQFKTLAQMNEKMYKFMLPALSNPAKYSGGGEIGFNDPGKNFETEQLAELSKQYLIIPMQYKDSDGQERDETLIKRLKKWESAKNCSKGKKIKSNVYFMKNLSRREEGDSEVKFYLLKDMIISLKVGRCHDFISALFYISNSRNYDMNNPKDSDAIKKLVVDLGMKKIENLKNRRFIDYLYAEAMDAKRTHNKSPLIPLQNFVMRNPDKKKVEHKSIAFAVEASNSLTADFNFYENLAEFRSNKDLLKQPVQLSEYTLVVQEDVHDTKISASSLDKLSLLPSVLINIERIAQIREFKILNDFLFLQNYSTLKALSSRSFDRIMNNETLETLGDSVLKTIATLHLFSRHKDKDENFMTHTRSQIINNEYLGTKGLESGLQFYLKKDVCPVKNWLPPFFKLVKRASGAARSGEGEYNEAQILSKKMVADCVEAVIGAAVLSTYRLYEPLRVLRRFKVLEEFDFADLEPFFTERFEYDLTCLDKLNKRVTENISYRSLIRLSEEPIYARNKIRFKMRQKVAKIKKSKNPKTYASEVKSIQVRDQSGPEGTFRTFKTFRNYVSDVLMRYSKKQKLFKLVSKQINGSFEKEYLNYKFTDKKYLMFGLRPFPRMKSNYEKKSFERQEFLGDAVIELVTLFIARKIFLYLKKSYTPEMLHGIKVVVLSTEGLARIFLHLKMHRYLHVKNYPVHLTEEIANFIECVNPHKKFKELWWNEAYPV